MVEKVIVAVDGGPASDAALAWVADRGRSTTLQVEIVTIVHDQRDSAEAELIEAFRVMRPALPHAVIVTRIIRGVPADQLILASHHADLLVVGSNRADGVSAALNVTVPLKVAGHSVCPTVVVPVGWRASADSVVAGWSDDPTAEAAVDFAAAEAARLDRALVIVHSGPDAPDRAVARVRGEHPMLRVSAEVEGAPAEALLARAAAHASLVVVGSRGRGAVASLLLGSVSHALLVSLPCPVAVLPPPRVPVDVYPELVDEQL